MLSPKEELELLKLQEEEDQDQGDARPDVSKVESGVRGAAQGLSMGFADELAGGAGAAVDTLRGNGEGDLVDRYRRNRDESRARFAAAKEANPATYTAGEIGGGVGTLAIPGAGEATIAKLAALGALQGLGASDADLTQGDVGGAARDTATGAGIGAGFGVAAKAATPVLRGAGNLLGAAGKRILASITGVPLEAIEERFARNAAIRGAKPFSQLAQELPGEMEKVSGALGKEAKAAREALSASLDPEEKALRKSTLLNMVRGLKGDLNVEGGGVVGESSERAGRTLDKLVEQIKGLGKNRRGTLKSVMGVPSAVPEADFVSERSAKDILQNLDTNINWEDPLASDTNSALEKLRGKLDARLKGQNPTYAERMEPVAEKTDLLRDMGNKFRVKQARGGGFVPSDSTENIVKSVGNEKRSETQKLLERLKSFTGRDMLQEAKDTATASEFDSGRTKRLFGMFSFKGGELAGKTVDITKHLADVVAHRPQMLGRFGPALMQAASRGAESLAAAHFLLQQQEPEYRKVLEDAEKGTQ